MGNQMRVAIIGGSGKMGLWVANFLLGEGYEVVITGRNEAKLLEAKRQLDVEVTTDNVEAVKRAKAIIISVPIDNFEGVVKQICSHIQPEQVIVEITSIKSFPIEVMHKRIKTASVLGIHPMFGPGAKGVTNQNFILTPTDDKEATLAQKIKQFLEARGARVAVMNPEEHDEMMAVILGLSHFIAIVSADILLGFDKLNQMRKIGGTSFKLLLMLVESVLSENPELYTSLQMNLPHVAEVERTFQKKVKDWADLVESKDSGKFVERMKDLKNRLNQVNPDFGKAYEDMYKLIELL